MNEPIYDFFWEGPFDWNKRHPYLKKYHVLYSIEGTHPVYGRDVLLYIGMTDGGIGNRLSDHEKWVEDEYDRVRVRVASVGKFINWGKWYQYPHYPKEDASIVSRVEALLIFAHQPAYNTMGKGSLGKKEGIRVFNTGMCGLLLPELSYLYHRELK